MHALRSTQTEYPGGFVFLFGQIRLDILFLSQSSVGRRLPCRWDGEPERGHRRRLARAKLFIIQIKVYLFKIDRMLLTIRARRRRGSSTAAIVTVVAIVAIARIDDFCQCLRLLHEKELYLPLEEPNSRSIGSRIRTIRRVELRNDSHILFEYKSRNGDCAQMIQ